MTLLSHLLASAAVAWLAFHFFATLGIPRPAIDQAHPLRRCRVIQSLLTAVILAALSLGAIWL